MPNYNRNKNLKIAGFFGQSGSGKTTIIRNTAKKINSHVIFQNTGIIRYLFKKNSHIKGYYVSPRQLIDDNAKILEELEGEKRDAKIDEIYESYIRSQFRLLNDWSTEVYLTTTEEYSTPCILLVDRSPIDFYALTICGMRLLRETYKKRLNDLCSWLMYLIRQTAEDNTNNFFNAIFVTKPWKTSDINKLKDGIRDQYLEDHYVGKKWYNKYKDVDLRDTETFYINESVIKLEERAELVNEKLKEI